MMEKHNSYTDQNVAEAVKRLITNLIENCIVLVLFRVHEADEWFSEKSLGTLITGNIVLIGVTNPLSYIFSNMFHYCT